MIAPNKIKSPTDESLDELCRQLVDLNSSDDAWPHEQLTLCGNYGVFEWFLPREFGQAWTEVDLVRGYLAISAACMTTTFVITQRTAACKRIAGCSNEQLKSRLLPKLSTGESFATVAISHLTTSRQHLKKPILTAQPDGDSGYILNGYSPWVTGADHADHIVTGATLEDQSQILVALPRELAGVSTPPPHQLVGLSGSHTGPLSLDEVRISSEWVIDGPREDIMGQASGGSTGGLQTSTLAVGLSQSAIQFLEDENSRRSDIADVTRSLRKELDDIVSDLLDAASGDSNCSKEDIRIRANSLVLRATQASLTAAKGTGYVASHPTGRWCREALFFLVWSCPQAVAAANLCELAGIAD